MKKNKYSKEMKEKSRWDLEEILKNQGNYFEEVVLAAQWELENRDFFTFELKVKPKEEVDSEQSKEQKGEDNTSEIEVLTSEIEEVFDGFPPKPKETIKPQNINRSIFSMLLFIAAFYLIFKWDVFNILILVVVILIHELGHYFAMRVFKYNDLGIYFVPLLGAFATGDKETISQKQTLIVLLAGPLPGIIIGIILVIIGLNDQNQLLYKVATTFLFINLFNLLPIMPLDGGKIVKIIFFDKNEIINSIFLIISIGVLTYFSIITKSYVLLIIPVLLVLQLNGQSKIKKIRLAIKEMGIETNKTFNDLTDKEYWLIRDKIAEHFDTFKQIITPRKYFISEQENRIIKQVKSIIQSHQINDLKILGKVLFTLILVLNIIILLFWTLVYLISIGVIKL